MGPLGKVCFLEELAFETVMNPNRSRFQEVESGSGRVFLEGKVVKAQEWQRESAPECSGTGLSRG